MGMIMNCWRQSLNMQLQGLKNARADNTNSHTADTVLTCRDLKAFLLKGLKPFLCDCHYVLQKLNSQAGDRHYT